MSSISIVGLGTMASALAHRALAGGNAVEIIGRDAAKANDLAAKLDGATVGTAGTALAGDIVILAVPYTSAAEVVSEYGDALNGKIVIDITNPANSDLSGGDSRGQFRSAGNRQIRACRRACRQGVQHRLCQGALDRRGPGPLVGRVRRRRRRQGEARCVGVHRKPGPAPYGCRAVALGERLGERRPAGNEPHEHPQAHQLCPGHHDS